MRLVAGFLVASATSLAADISPEGPVSFTKHVLPILQRNCQSCHRPGNVAPMSFLTYESTRPWAKAMKAAVVSRKMPPWFADPNYSHFSNDLSLKQSEIDTIAKWADTGSPQGDPKDAPPPVAWPENGWTTKPDTVLKGIPWTVPAAPPKNVIEWATVVTPGNFTHDTWVTSIEIKPSELGVTHHICTGFIPHQPGVVYNTPEWVDKQRDEAGVEVAPSQRTLRLPTADGKGKTVARSDPRAARIDIGHVCFVPGRALHDFRIHNAAVLVPKGYDVLWNIHYTPNGKEVTDRPEIGLTVTDKAPQRLMIANAAGSANPATFAIPPNDSNYSPDPIAIIFHEDAELVWMAPHMHLRGKEMTYRLEYPDGRSEVILSVPHYDFNWQLAYELAQPIRVPKGSKLVITAHYDNSANNKFNPDPNRTVYIGNMTWEEMLGPFIGVTVDKSVDPMKAYTAPFANASRGGA